MQLRLQSGIHIRVISGGSVKKHTFHSFRHYFIDNLKQRGYSLPVVSEISGHSYNSIAFERYGKSYSIKYKKKILDDSSNVAISRLPSLTNNKKITFGILTRKIGEKCETIFRFWNKRKKKTSM
ncbi:tyrosine-type recombinase/integrase [Vibrio profundi]|uniref:tyrosine-type recombinase/integrase n=1 Tax=Vibrio profundi TaxID=1774960 RepID=UPI003735B565